MSSELKIDGLVRIVTPRSVKSNQIGRITKVAKFIDTAGTSKCRYLLKFKGHDSKLWYFDYEVEAVDEEELFTVGDLVQCSGFSTNYRITGVDPEAGTVDVRAVAPHATLFRSIPSEIFKLHNPHKEAKCSACGQTIEHNDQ